MSWLNLWNGPKEPSKYLKTIINISVNVLNWSKHPDILKMPINMSLLFHPSAFLAAMKQQVAR